MSVIIYEYTFDIIHISIKYINGQLILSISHQEGDISKSTIVWNLAYELHKHIDAIILDLIIQREQNLEKS